ncbi:MAG: response regulator [Proteobacteria bacterium]|nr:response regulator [Pseudomonadota bacterium]MBI3495884.1 response regulator [Pseudomonadota bacterium]
MATVLVIEDDPRFRKLVRAMLEGEGHAVRTASDGLEGIDRFTRCRPDLVITDLIMPRIDGIQTISVLRGLDPSVPIIAISGGSADLLKLAATTGPAAILAKPFTDRALRDAVLEALDTSGYRN